MIFLGADHRGYELKEKIKKYLKNINIEYNDCGTDSEKMVNYPEIAKKVCGLMNVDKDKAILICGSGIGMSMVANKYKGVRAGICFSTESAHDGKEHSNLNVLVLPGDFIDEELAKDIINIWLNSAFLEGRYLDRLKMVEKIEKDNFK